jgi:hypothetical protein
MPESRGIALRSDFVDYYDHHLGPAVTSIHPQALIWERFATGGLDRAGLFGVLAAAGIKCPLVDTLDAMRRLLGPMARVVVYTDPRAHRGEGKELMTLGAALGLYPKTTLASKYVEPPAAVAESVRWLQVGARRFWLKYTNGDRAEWRSNVGAVAVELLPEEPPADLFPAIQDPLAAIDFVRDGAGNKWAVDFNTAPGLDPLKAILPAPEAAALIKDAVWARHAVAAKAGG